MDPIIYCRIRLAAQEIASSAEVAYWTRGNDRKYHRKQLMEEYRKLEALVSAHMSDEPEEEAA